MKRAIVVISMLLATVFAAHGALAAIGKCTVVNVDGDKMVIECNKQTKGFAKGNQIKIKTDREKAGRNKN